MITIKQSNNKVTTIDIAKIVKETYKEDTDVQQLSDEQIENEYIAYITNYGVDTPIVECIVDNLMEM